MNDVRRLALVGSVVCGLTLHTTSASVSTYDDNVRALYTKQTYSNAGDIVDLTFRGFSQYGMQVGITT